jgi:hypothetical protein
MNQEPQQHYSGSPVEVGATLATDALNPTIMQTIEDGVTDQQLMGMLTGIVLFVVGTASMTIGHDEAVQMMKRCLDHLEKSPPQAPQAH